MEARSEVLLLIRKIMIGRDRDLRICMFGLAYYKRHSAAVRGKDIEFFSRRKDSRSQSSVVV